MMIEEMFSNRSVSTWNWIWMSMQSLSVPDSCGRRGTANCEEIIAKKSMELYDYIDGCSKVHFII